jgi:hypothetical protein
MLIEQKKTEDVESNNANDIIEQNESFMNLQKEVIVSIKSSGLLVSIMIAALLTAFSADTDRSHESRRMLRDLGIFFWVFALLFTWSLRREIRALMSETARGCNATFSFMRIWSHSVINTVFVVMFLAVTIMSICLADDPKLQDNPIFLAFYAMVCIATIVSFCCGGYHVFCLIRT